MTQPPGWGSTGDGAPPPEPPPSYGPPPTYGQPENGQPTYGPPPYGQPTYVPQAGPYGVPPAPGYYAGPPPGYYGPPPPAWYPPGFQAPRPGCVPLRPLGVGDILDGAFKATRRNPRVMLGLSAGFAFVQVLLTTLVSLVVFSNLADARSDDGTVDLGPLLGGEGLQLLTLFVSFLLGAVLTGMLTVVVTQDVLGRRVDARAVWAQVRPRLGTLIGLALVTTLLEFLGLLPCLVLGVWLWGIWAVAVPACIVERIGIRAALGRSHQLVSGTFWRVWGIRALGYVVLQVVAQLIALPFLVIGLVGGGGLGTLVDPTGTPVLMLLLINLGTLIAATLVAPVRAAIDALLYVDLRMRKEGLDIVLQQAAAAPPPTTAG